MTFSGLIKDKEVQKDEIEKAKQFLLRLPVGVRIKEFEYLETEIRKSELNEEDKLGFNNIVKQLKAHVLN